MAAKPMPDAFTQLAAALIEAFSIQGEGVHCLQEDVHDQLHQTPRGVCRTQNKVAGNRAIKRN
ncbi:hypothetical protein GWG65_37350 [Bradyrhizobium sp. CSA207]|uniref:hypothetical protein n=1 Tax=Bradyrhizobium sp. CSA207 TaxID=2698826 RepID=UPI0023AFFC4B|nr:hypothetical protein [Bradyrhizobium sp. CSA207]MDE5446906.1 hypothetical protein [Bradyrhizobium sp. CSA207]